MTTTQEMQADPGAAYLDPDIQVLARLRAIYSTVSWTLPGDAIHRGWVEGSVSPTTPESAAEAADLIDHFGSLAGWDTSSRSAGRDYTQLTATGWWAGVPVSVRATIPKPDPLTAAVDTTAPEWPEQPEQPDAPGEQPEVPDTDPGEQPAEPVGPEPVPEREHAQAPVREAPGDGG